MADAQTMELQELQTMGKYMLNYLAAVDVLTKEQSYLDGIASSLFGTQAERAEAAAVAAVIGTQLLLLASAHNTIVSKFQGGVNPPGEVLVTKSHDLTRQLANVVRHETRASVILTTVTKFVEDWALLA